MVKRLSISPILPFILFLLFGLSISKGFAQPGTIDPTFNVADVGFGRGDGADIWVDATVLLPDGKYLIGGAFAKYNDVPCKGITRINQDGTIDPTWNPGGAGATNASYGEVYNIAVQPDGKIIIVGDFTKYNGVTRNRVARLNSDGTLDTSFDPGTGLNNLCTELVLLSDGKILVAGAFSTVNGVSCISIARLNSDGSRDVTFNSGGSGISSSGSSYSNSIGALLVLADGRIYIGGSFTYYNGTIRIREAILFADGTLDPTFTTPGSVGGPSATVQDAAQQPDGKLVIVGDFGNYNGITRKYIARINLDGTLDMTLNPSYSSTIGFDAGLRTVDILPDGDILASGQAGAYSGTTISKIARLNSDGSLDTGFNTGAGFSNPGYSSYVSISMPQPDGKILIGGTFRYFDGEYYKNLVRLNADGTLDPTFNAPSGFNSGAINSVKELPDGKLLVGGEFNRFNGESWEGLVKLNADGTVDPSFIPTNFASFGDFRMVRKIIVQPDQKILIAGSFYGVAGTARKCIARLNADGSLDATFTPNVTISDTIHAMVLQPDGKVLIGGKFSAVDGVSRVNLARLNADGTLDASFTVGTSGFLGTIRALALQADGKVLVGGDMTYYGGTINRIVRLNTDGTKDVSFNVGNGCDKTVNSIVVQPDGKILIGGRFGVFNSTLQSKVARVLPNGSPDGTFSVSTGFNNSVSEITLRDDGKIYVGGLFTTFNGIAAKGVTCLNASGSLNTSFQLGTGALNTTDVRSILPLSNDRLLISGDFTSYNGVGHNRMVWLQNPANTYSTINQTVCSSFTAPSGTVYNASGTYTDVIPNAQGSDSIISLNLVVNPTLYHDDNISSCGSYTWINGTTYTSSTTATQTLASQTGCDSIVTLHLTINQPSSGIANVSACSSYTWVNGVTYTSSTSAPTHMLTTVHGCDSLVTLHLTINNPSSGTFVHSACNSYTWINGVTYTSSTSTPTHLLQNSHGCDSLVTLHLTILHSTSASFNVSSCNSYFWGSSGVTYTNSGTHSATLTNVAGCDSIVTLNLTILQPTTSVVTMNSCGNYTWPQNGVNYTASGNYTYTTTNAVGCDSVITLNLTINPLPVISAADDGHGVITAAGGTTFQWLNCASNTIIDGEENVTFTASEDGSYAVIVTTSEGCSDTSQCVVIDYLGIKDAVLYGLSVFPNPTKGIVYIDAKGIGETTTLSEIEVVVTDYLGQLVSTITSVNNSFEVDLTNQPTGVYFIQVKYNDQSYLSKCVKL